MILILILILDIGRKMILILILPFSRLILILDETDHNSEQTYQRVLMFVYIIIEKNSVRQVQKQHPNSVKQRHVVLKYWVLILIFKIN